MLFFEKTSVNKSRLKMDLVLQFFLCILMIVRVLPGFTAFLGLGMFDRLQHWDVPPPRPWEYLWIVSLMAAILGLKSIPRNESSLLKQYIIGTVVFGLVPVIYGIVDQIDDLYEYLNEKKSRATMIGYPAVIVWFMFLTMAMQLHGFGLYFASQLMKAWRPRKKTK